jgi:hypothetical protein
MKIKTAELIGPALDWAVSKSDGWDGPDLASYLFTSRHVKPSVDWSQGGPIIEREKFKLHCGENNIWWAATNQNPHRPLSGPTPLTAAMRCYVASVLGDEVDVPEECL